MSDPGPRFGLEEVVMGRSSRFICESYNLYLLMFYFNSKEKKFRTELFEKFPSLKLWDFVKLMK